MGLMQDRREMRNRANSAYDQQGHRGIVPGMNEASRTEGQLNRNMGDARSAMDMARMSAMGQGPSMATQQLAAGRQQGLVDQMSMAAAARGGSLASQQRAVQGMGAANAMGNARDAAMMRQQEMMQGQAAYGQQAQGLAGLAAQQQMAAQGNLMNAYGQQYAGAAQYDLAQRGMDIQSLGANREWGLKVAQQANTAGAAAAGTFVKAFSDERVKDIESRDAGDEAIEAVRGLGAIKYRYKDKKHGPTDHDVVGFSAQELEKSKAGAQLITDSPEGKQFDVAGVASLSLAAVSAMAKRLDKMERPSGLAGVRRG